MRLLDDVVAALRAADITHAVIGAAAMAAHGVSRATADVDLLTTDSRALLESTWTLISDRSAVDIRKGGDDDPLAGVVRISGRGELDVDVIVGNRTWQHDCVSRARPPATGGPPIVRSEDLVLLKLYAGGPQDAWDIHQLLALPDGSALVAGIDELVTVLPSDAQALWQRIRAERRTS